MAQPSGKKVKTKIKMSSSLSNKELASLALALIDKEGVEALSFRRLSEEANMPTMTICNRFGSKYELMKAALSVMLEEVTVDQIPGETWQDSLRRVARLNRDMALRHPKAFMLFVLVPIFESPVYEFTKRVFSTHEDQGIPSEMPAIFLSLMHSFLPGFQLAEAYANEQKKDVGKMLDREYLLELFNEKSFYRNLDIIITGLQEQYGLPAERKLETACDEV